MSGHVSALRTSRSGDGRAGIYAVAGLVALCRQVQRSGKTIRACDSLARWPIRSRDDALGLIPSSTEGRVIESALTVGDSPLIIDVNEIMSSPLFRSAWLEGQRCILPMSGFYAWQLTNRRYRQPHFVHLLDRSVFGIAAIWDRSVTEDDDVIESCAMICVPPNELVVRVANTDGCMPAILRRKDYQTWLRDTPVAAKATLHSYNKGRMQAYAVSPRINSTAPDDPGLIQAAELVV